MSAQCFCTPPGHSTAINSARLVFLCRMLKTEKNISGENISFTKWHFSARALHNADLSPSLPDVNSYLSPQRTNLNLGKWEKWDNCWLHFCSSTILSLKYIPSWGPGHLNQALRVKISWEIGKWIIEWDHYTFRLGRKSSNELTLETSTSWLLMTPLLWMLILSMGLIDVVHSPVNSQWAHCVSVLFSDQSLSICELLNWDTFPSVLLEQFCMKNQYPVTTIPLSPRDCMRVDLFLCVLFKHIGWSQYVQCTRFTDTTIVHPIPILFIRGCSELGSIPRSHLNLNPPTSFLLHLLIDILHPAPCQGWITDHILTQFITIA